MNFTYIIMDESRRSERPRRPELGADDYCTRYTLGEDGVRILKERTYCKAERVYIEQNADRLAKTEWAYNMVYLMKQACGHYEVFQTHVKGKREAEEWLKLMAEEALLPELQNCRRVCNFDSCFITAA